MAVSMRYKTLTFPINPKTFSISAVRNIHTYHSPFTGMITQDYGAKTRVITGSGEYYSLSAQTNFNNLWNLFVQKNHGILVPPSGQYITAIFSSLKMVGEAGPDIIKYAFEFIEVNPDNYYYT